ncbi:MAG: endolytic transglycosylase MltG [Syntrophomonadaceae bacterium]|jgi:UPF0755 protein
MKQSTRLSGKKAMKLFIAIGLAVSVVGGIIGLANYNHSKYAPVDPTDHTPIKVVIAENSSARDVAAILKELDLIKNEKTFVSYCKSHKLDGKLQAGTFQLSRSQSLSEIADCIAGGRIMTFSFTIPEGYTVEQIGNLLNSRNICSLSEWEKALESPYDFEFFKYIPQDLHSLEGFLFPDTYYISEHTTAEEIVEMMLRRFQEVWYKDFDRTANQRGMPLYEAVIIASMIEEEAMVAEERSIISGVIQNRLKNQMLLQIDATVLYALSEHKTTVTYADLEVDSPYNTYKYPGLPPGPICCPGKASINAALNPQEHKYYYYVAKGDGSHHFSRTFEEHQGAIRRYAK